MITLDNLSIGYDKRLLISGACLTIPKGRTVALIGRNGTGKSTLLNTLAGLMPPIRGKVMVQGENIQTIRPIKKAQLVSFVTTERLRIANLRCHDVVALGRAPYTDWIGRTDANDEAIVMRSLEQVGMRDYAERNMDRMSDGECQRIMIARALAQCTPVILLDEPTSFLDMPNRYEMCLLLKRLAHEEGKCIIFSTHELDIALSVCDDIVLIDTPDLIYGKAKDMADSGAIERLFRSANVVFDPKSQSIKPII